MEESPGVLVSFSRRALIASRSWISKADFTLMSAGGARAMEVELQA
jgi:hypothetical protein